MRRNPSGKCVRSRPFSVARLRGRCSFSAPVDPSRTRPSACATLCRKTIAQSGGDRCPPRPRARPPRPRGQRHPPSTPTASPRGGRSADRPRPRASGWDPVAAGAPESRGAGSRAAAPRPLGPRPAALSARVGARRGGEGRRGGVLGRAPAGRGRPTLRVPLSATPAAAHFRVARPRPAASLAPGTRADVLLDVVPDPPQGGGHRS